MSAARGPDLLNRPGVAYLRFDLRSGSIIDVSPSVEALLGYSPDDFVRNSDLAARLMHPDFAREFPGMVARWSLEKPADVRFEAQYLARDGREVWLKVTGRLEYAKDGALAGLSAVSQDITAIVLARRAADEGRALYSDLFRSAPTPLVVYDANTLAIEDANAFAAAMYGIAQPELCGSHFDERASEAERPRAVERLRGGGPSNPVYIVPRTVHVKGDGSEFPVQVVSVAVHAGSRPLRLAVVRDLTGADTVEQTSRVLHSALDLVPAPVLILDKAGLVAFANPALETLSGRTLAQLEGKEFGPHLAPTWDRAWKSAVGVALRGGTWFGKVEMRGAREPIGVRFHPLLTAEHGVAHVVAVFGASAPKGEWDPNGRAVRGRPTDP